MDKLSRIPGFLPYILIVFLNAFVDLGHKILIQNTVFKVYDGQTQIILTAIVNGLILLPFVLLFSPSGFLSDKYAKPRVIKIAAAVAVGLTLLITLSYYQGWFQFAFGLTFLLAVQSAFYSPAKYGYIKELTGKERLTTANAVVQAVTIVAILSGIFVFSMLFEQRLVGVDYSTEPEILQTIYPIGWVLVACSRLSSSGSPCGCNPSRPSRRISVSTCVNYGSGPLPAQQYRKMMEQPHHLAVHRRPFRLLGDIAGRAGRLSRLRQGEPGTDQHRRHSGHDGLLRNRHHHRFPDRGQVVQTSHRNRPGSAGRAGHRHGAAVHAAARINRRADHRLSAAGNRRRHVHRAAERADTVPLQGQRTRHRAGGQQLGAEPGDAELPGADRAVCREGNRQCRPVPSADPHRAGWCAFTPSTSCLNRWCVS